MLDYKDIIFIINPHSGTLPHTDIIRQIEKLSSDLPYVVTHTLDELHLFFEKRKEDFSVFIIAGGDGSLNEVLTHFINRPDKALCVYPNGSGNGFASSLNYTPDVNKIVDAALRNETRPIDTLKINDKWCVNVGGIGADAYIAHEFDSSSGRGLKNYVRLVVKAFLRFTPFEAEIDIDGVVHKDKFLLIALANLPEYGNGAMIAPEAVSDDGQYNIVLMHPMPIHLYALVVRQMLKGELIKSKYVTYINTSSNIKVISSYPLYHVDGQPHTNNTGEYQISFHGHAIRFIRME